MAKHQRTPRPRLNPGEWPQEKELGEQLCREGHIVPATVINGEAWRPGLYIRAGNRELWGRLHRYPENVQHEPLVNGSELMVRVVRVKDPPDRDIALCVVSADVDLSAVVRQLFEQDGGTTEAVVIGRGQGQEFMPTIFVRLFDQFRARLFHHDVCGINQRERRRRVRNLQPGIKLRVSLTKAVMREGKLQLKIKEVAAD